MSDAPFRIVLAILLAGLTACTTAQEQPDRETQRPGTESTPQAQEEHAAATQPGRGAPGAKAGQAETPDKKPLRRRSVQQVIGSAPPPPAASESYRPTLDPRAPAAPVPAPASRAPVAPPPSQLNSCQGNLCTDAAGSSYNTGIGNSAINSQGRLCNRVGTTMHCF